MTAITIASVYVHGHRKAYGTEWVAKLHAGAVRNADGLTLRHVCLTDSPAMVKDACRHVCEIETVDIGKWWRKLNGDRGAIRGWWAKVHLFAPGVFQDGERVLAVDIDNLIVSSLRPFVEEHAHLPAVMAPHTAPNFNPPGTVNHFSSTVMLWTAGTHMERLFTRWGLSCTSTWRGDQDWFGASMPDLPTFARQYMCRMPRTDDKMPPEGCVFVAGGKVKPDEAAKTRAWVRKAWRTE